MRTSPCACGATLYAPEAMELWEDILLAHVRTQRHCDWWERQQLLGEAVPALDIAVSPGGLLSPIAVAQPVWLSRKVA